MKIAAMPSFLQNLVTTSTQSVETNKATVCVDDSDWNQQRCIGILRSCGIVLCGERNNIVYKAACQLKNEGLTEGTTLRLISEHLLCERPLPYDELQQTVRSAYEHSQSGQGTRHPNVIFAQFADEHEWPEPKEIKTELLQVPALAPDMIPESYRDWLTDISYRMQVPLDFVAATAIVMTGAVIGAGCGIRPKRQDDWLVVPNLWGGVVGRPGVLKTPALTEALKPLARLEINAEEVYSRASTGYEASERKIEATKNAIKDEMKKAAKQDLGSTDKASASLDELEKKYSELQLSTKPTRRRFKTNDATIEKLGELLKENPRGLQVYRDELIGLLRSWGKQGREEDRQFFLEGWNGYGSYDSDRIGRGNNRVPNMCISLFGGIQPTKLLEYLYQARKDTDGLVPRFQLLVYPDLLPDWKLIDQWPNALAKNKAFAVLEALAQMDFTSYGAFCEEEQKRPFFRFNDQAQEFFYEWLTNLEQNKLRADEEPIILEHLSKYRSLMPSLALIFHLIEIAGGTASGPVTKEAATKAVLWCAYLEAHARRIYGLITDLATKAAARLAEQIKKGKLTSSFTVREVQRKGWTLLDDNELVTDACEELVGLGWLKEIPILPSERGGRPTIHYFINPKLASMGKIVTPISEPPPLTWNDLI